MINLTLELLKLKCLVLAAAESADIDEVYKTYHQSVNMTLSQLERWSKTKASTLASVDRAPIQRKLFKASMKNGNNWYYFFR